MKESYDEPFIESEGIFEDEPPKPSPEMKEFGNLIREVASGVFASMPAYIPPPAPDIEYMVKLVGVSEIERELLSLLQSGYSLIQSLTQFSDGQILLAMQKITYKVPQALDSDQLNADEKKDTMKG